MAQVPMVQADVWACCDNIKCEKWRRLPPGSVVDEEKIWFCTMNPDPTRNSCNAPEESYDKEGEKVIVQPLPVLPPPRAAPLSAQPREPERGQLLSRGKTGGAIRGQGRPANSQKRQSDTTHGQEAAAKRPRVSQAPASAPSRVAQYTSVGGPPGQLASLQPRSWAAGVRPPGAGMLRPQVDVGRQHQAFNKLMARAGLWEVVKGKGRTLMLPPAWVWEALGQRAPQAASLACQAVDMSSAASYFQGASAEGKAQADDAFMTARLSLTAAAALASLETEGQQGTSAVPAQQTPSFRSSEPIMGAMSSHSNPLMTSQSQLYPEYTAQATIAPNIAPASLPASAPFNLGGSAGQLSSPVLPLHAAVANAAQQGVSQVQ